MRSVAVFKWSVNPEDARVGADGSVDWGAASPWVGDDDYVAARVASQVAGEDGEAVGLTLAGGDVAFAAARGARSTLAVDGLPAPAGAAGIAAALAAAVRTLGADVVAIGDSAWEPAVPALLAGLLGWPALMAVDSAVAQEGGLVVTRRSGMGTQDLLVGLPVVLGVVARREEEDKPGMRAVLTARKLPVTTVAVADLGPGGPAFTGRGTSLPETEPSRLMDGADPERAAAQLVQALRSEGVL